MNDRYIGAMFLAPLVIFLFLGGVFLKYGIMVLSLLGLYEFYKVSKKKNNAFPAIGYIFTILYFVLLNRHMDLKLIIFLVILFTLICLVIPVVNTKYTYIDSAITVLGFLYVPVFFSFIVLINQMKYGYLLIWLVFISSWLCDTSAYYVGRLFGKTKLCPKVSPKKTVEGSIGGLLGSALACGIFGYIISRYGINIPLYHYFIIGGICGIMCQFGDLTASSIKRYADVKDYSHLIPGHGGILDRFDSILFASVVVYYYMTIIVGM